MAVNTKSGAKRLPKRLVSRLGPAYSMSKGAFGCHPDFDAQFIVEKLITSARP
jgi:hypothetical protein